MNNRLELLKKKMHEEQMNSLIISDFYNLRYFADVTIHTGERLLTLLVNSDNTCYLFVNELFAAKESDDYSIVYYKDSQDPIKIMAKYIRGNRIGIDKSWSSGFLLRLMKLIQGEYIDGSSIMTYLRAIKSKDEQQLMVKASLDNDAVMEEIIPFIRLGMSEKELYNKLLELFEKRTGEPVSFEPIVGFGINCADPHHESDNTILKEGDAVLIDMGSHYKGYCSDMTRTFLQKDSKALEIYEIVKEANILAEKAIRPGMKFKEIDKVARDYISSKGYGKYFTHRLGHGIGLEVHEGYDVSESDEVIIEEGMCFSIEPGIYLPEIAGVRIEDLVICQKDGAQVLNHFSKEIHILDL